jgi:hypothetical protein
VIVDATWDRFPTAARIREIADELAFFAVDADDRQMTALEAVAQLGEMAMPSLANSSVMVVIVRRDQRKPVMGSPAVSCSSRQWRTAIRSGGFFPPEYDLRPCGEIGR